MGKIEPSVVTRVDEEKGMIGCFEVLYTVGYVDLSKRRVAEDDMRIADKKYQEAKKVHNIAGILANHCHMDIDDVYVKIIWPLAHKYDSAYNAFLLSVS